MPIMDAAYDAAWTCLVDRYKGPRHIANTLLKRFVNLPSTARADVTVLRKVTVGATGIVRGLDAAGQTIKDCWFIHLILRKIGNGSKEAGNWNLRLWMIYLSF